MKRYSTDMIRWAAAGLTLVGVAACSSKPNLTDDFTSAGVRPPSGQCTVNPRSIADAVSIGSVDGKGACGIKNAWKVSAIGDVAFSTPARIRCQMVGATNSWIGKVVQPAARSAFGERVVKLRIAASYACRGRDNRRGAKISEHAFGNALDVSAFTLASGRVVEVEGGWKAGGKESAFLKRVHGRACGTFTTVLGPEANAAHRNHFHFDLGKHGRSGKGKYCR
ncbi:extensin-like domain-containing protein [Anderseniella sp. Alg231-50]|uniref:extensin-like domain-containing protein n=1 Tax=Anderseniella sp. Alg231-50 TaxID=1922226 RepID=UPI00307BE7F2